MIPEQTRPKRTTALGHAAPSVKFFEWRASSKQAVAALPVNSAQDRRRPPLVIKLRCALGHGDKRWLWVGLLIEAMTLRTEEQTK
jgi:hypothetical protein